MDTYDYLLKIIIVGNPSVGKSCISSVLSNQGFNSEYSITIGVDFFVVKRNINNTRWKLHLWDTAGQENFKSITRTYYRQTAICFLVYDLTKQDTFDKLPNWKADVLKENNNTYFVLFGNKTDLVDKRVIDYEVANKWATDNNMLYHEVSAKYNKFGEDDIFTLILKDFDKEKDKDNNDGVKPGNNKISNTNINKKRTCDLFFC